MRQLVGRSMLTITIAAGLIFSACSDDDNPGGKQDKGATVDKGGADAGADQGAADIATPDLGSTPDKTSSPDAAAKPTGVPCAKDSDCYPTVPHCDPTNKVCVECLKANDCALSTSGGLCSAGRCTCASDSDCKGTRVWGGKCLTGSQGGKACGCGATADCSGTSMGATCDSTNKVCACSAAGDCKTGNYTVCSQSFMSTTTVKNCNTACKADSACSKEIDRKVCDTTAGGCVECNKSADCAVYPESPWSLTCSSTKFCVECLTSADCTSKSLGNSCNTKNYWCECKTAADCTKNENGAVCNSNVGACSCKTDTDCPTGKKCTRTSPYLPGLKYCQ